MAEAGGGLKSWREILASPLPEPPKGSGGDIPEEVASTNHTNQQTSNSLRVGLLVTEPTNLQQTSAPVVKEEVSLSNVDCQQDMKSQMPESAGLACLILGCRGLSVDIAYCRQHRAMADGGTLWEGRRD